MNAPPGVRVTTQGSTWQGPNRVSTPRIFGVVVWTHRLLQPQVSGMLLPAGGEEEEEENKGGGRRGEVNYGSARTVRAQREVQVALRNNYYIIKLADQY